MSPVLCCGGRTGPSGSVYGGGKGEEGPLGICEADDGLVKRLGMLELNSRK